MTRRTVLLGVLLATVGGAASQGTSGPSSYFDLIGVGCVPWRPDGASLSWRPEFPGIPAHESMRLFKSLEGEETRRCLALIVEADEVLAAQARTLGPKTAPATFAKILAAIHGRWNEFGVGEALEEVAKSGTRGPKTEAFLSRCHALDRSAPSAPGDRP